MFDINYWLTMYIGISSIYLEQGCSKIKKMLFISNIFLIH